MSSDEYEYSSAPNTGAAQNVESSSVCKVCGNKDPVMYLGIQCCSACKMFFRRNADFDLNANHCVFDQSCDMTVNSRGACRYCRLKKCFSVGLKKDFLHGSHSHQSHDQKKKKQKTSTKISNEITISLPDVIPTLDLLINDRSLLSTDQWSLLSYVTHAYDDKSPTLAIRNTIARQLTYPSKMRIKMAINYFKDIASLLYLSAGPFIKTMPEFLNMSIDDQGILVERNITSMSGFGAILVMRESEICKNPYYYNASVANYGHPFTDQVMRILDRTDSDGTLIKLMVPILALSTCSDVLNPNTEETTGGTTTPGGTRIFSNTLNLLELQNIYAEMMFKYMMYRYGYKEASLRFASLIKSCIDQNLMVSGDGELEKYHQMIQSITDQTERSLTIIDELIE